MGFVQSARALEECVSGSSFDAGKSGYGLVEVRWWTSLKRSVCGGVIEKRPETKTTGVDVNTSGEDEDHGSVGVWREAVAGIEPCNPWG
jgi:hypothetical protein